MSEIEILVQKIKAAVKSNKDKEVEKITNLVKQINKVIHK